MGTVISTTRHHPHKVARLYDVRRESASAHSETCSRCRFLFPAHRRHGFPAKMEFSISIILICIAGSLAAPVDEPIRVDLPVYDQPQASSDVEMVPAESSGVDSRSDRTVVANIISRKLHTATNALGQKLSQQHAYGVAGQFDGGYFAAPVTTLEGALLETEGLGSRKLSIKENLHGIVAGLLQPKPIVDTISEEEKYGNTGDKFYGAGRALVGGAEGVSNLVNSVLEVPGTIFRKITRIATEKLNNLGGKLIGL